MMWKRESIPHLNSLHLYLPAYYSKCLLNCYCSKVLGPLHSHYHHFGHKMFQVHINVHNTWHHQCCLQKTSENSHRILVYNRAVEIPCPTYPTCPIFLRTRMKFQCTCPGTRTKALAKKSIQIMRYIDLLFHEGKKKLWVLIRNASLRHF